MIERIAEPAAVHSARRSKDLFSKELQVRLDGTEFTTDCTGRYLTTNGMVPAARSRHHPARARVVQTVDCAGRGRGQAVAR